MLKTYASGFLIMAFLSITFPGFFLFSPALAQCIDYDDYLHWAGEVDAPNRVWDIILHDNFAYIADMEKGFQTVDISSPGNPVVVGNLDTGTNTRALALAGDLVYVLAGSSPNSVLLVVDISNLRASRIVGRVDLPAGLKLAISGEHAYVTSGSEGLLVVDISDPRVPELVGSVDLGPCLGVATKGDFAFVATNHSVVVVDITSAEAPVVVGSVEVDTPRDIAIRGDLAYVAGRVFTVLDITDPQFSSIVGFTELPSHNLAVSLTISGNHAFYSGHGVGLGIVDISAPEAPLAMGIYEVPGIHLSLAIQDDYAYISGESMKLQVLDITSLEIVQPLGSIQFAGISTGIAVWGDYSFSAAGSLGLRVVDISTPETPEFVGTFGEHCSNVVIQGEYAYLTGYNSGFRVVDITNPEDPVTVGSIEAPDSYLSVQGSYAYLMSSVGMLVVDISNPEMPEIVGEADMSDGPIEVFGNYAYIRVYPGNLLVVDVSSPETPLVIEFIELGFYIVQFVAQNNHLYCVGYSPGSDWMGLKVLDVSDPGLPAIVAEIETPGRYIGALAVSGNQAYFAASNEFESRLHVLDISSPAEPITISHVYIPDPVYFMAIARTGVCLEWVGLCGQTKGLMIVPVQCPDERAFGFSFGQRRGSSSDTAHSQAIQDDSQPIIIATPNPFNPSTTLTFNLPKPGFCRLEIHDLRGQMVRTLCAENRSAGSHQFIWQGQDDAGRQVSSGVYFARLVHERGAENRKLVLLK